MGTKKTHTSRVNAAMWLSIAFRQQVLNEQKAAAERNAVSRLGTSIGFIDLPNDPNTLSLREQLGASHAFLKVTISELLARGESERALEHLESFLDRLIEIHIDTYPGRTPEQHRKKLTKFMDLVLGQTLQQHFAAHATKTKGDNEFENGFTNKALAMVERLIEEKTEAIPGTTIGSIGTTQETTSAPAKPAAA